MPDHLDPTAPSFSDSVELSPEELKTAVILAQAKADCDAGLGLRGQQAEAFLSRVLETYRAKVIGS